MCQDDFKIHPIDFKICFLEWIVQQRNFVARKIMRTLDIIPNDLKFGLSYAYYQSCVYQQLKKVLLVRPITCTSCYL